MTADTKIFAGGDGTILAAFDHKNKAERKDDSVNELIAQCAQSKESLEKLYRMYKSSVFAVAFAITADYHLAEDCVTETFVRLTTVRSFSAKKGDGRGFILTVARNVALELRRREKKAMSSFIIQSYGEAEQTVEDSIFINQLLKHLSDKQRQIVILRCCAELPFKEIAKIMKCPETTVKSRYKKAISILQEKAGDDR